ncbi:MAG: hypothetical protein N2544_08850 [Burkholderiales bacterium]|nr:hypothetical protein [Burkholderiales bacterium]
MLTDLANTLREQGAIDERESFIDASVVSAEGGRDALGKIRRSKGVKILSIVRRRGLPLAARRWIVERFFAWPQRRRRLLVRCAYEPRTSRASCGSGASRSSSGNSGEDRYPFLAFSAPDGRLPTVQPIDR